MKGEDTTRQVVNKRMEMKVLICLKELSCTDGIYGHVFFYLKEMYIILKFTLLLVATVRIIPVTYILRTWSFLCQLKAFYIYYLRKW